MEQLGPRYRAAARELFFTRRGIPSWRFLTIAILAAGLAIVASQGHVAGTIMVGAVLLLEVAFNVFLLVWVVTGRRPGKKKT